MSDADIWTTVAGSVVGITVIWRFFSTWFAIVKTKENSDRIVQLLEHAAKNPKPPAGPTQP